VQLALGIKGTQMNITFSPQAMSGSLELSKAGDILTINGEEFDFSFIEEGDFLPQEAVDCPYVIYGVTRTDGEIVLTLMLPVTSDASEAARFPAPILNAPDGAIEVPV
jgi:hypothetical protein